MYIYCINTSGKHKNITRKLDRIRCKRISGVASDLKSYYINYVLCRNIVFDYPIFIEKDLNPKCNEE